ncbi:hypothetical protein BX600DRAFT_56943 [Xylariales sp. PMI_506]|nr:hypothetical protein BX600DRAFT_56943 [Xylariales sp. PMI_506]
MPPQACEACYKNKSKCKLSGDEIGCGRCIRLGKACRPRAVKRMGRPPAVAQFAHGTCDIISIESSHLSVKKGKRQDSSPNTSSDGTRTSSAALSDPEVELIEVAHRSCNQVSHGKFADSPRCMRPTIMFSGLIDMSGNDTHWQLSHMLETRAGFFAVHRHFMIGSSFSDPFQSTVRRLFSHAPQLMAEAYCAILDILDVRHWLTSSTLPDSIDLTRGVRCLQTLVKASASIAESVDAAAVLMLGQIMLVYNLLVPSPSIHTIVRNTLLSTKDWYPALIEQPELNCVTLAPIFVDTIGCLIRREVPIVRLPAMAYQGPADRFLGLCLTLLPLLYDLCELSHCVKLTGSQELDPYAGIEQQIIAWEPAGLFHLTEKHPPSEVVSMLAQAHTYRFAALLIIHRLRFPLGVEDEVGKYYAERILQEMSVLTEWKVGDSSGFGANFPLLVVGLELPDHARNFLGILEPLRFEPRRSNKILNFVKYVHDEMRRGYQGLWFDFLENFSGLTVP